MNTLNRTTVSLLTCVVLFASFAYAQGEYGANDFRIKVDARGQVASFHDAVHRRERLVPTQPAPLVAVKKGDKTEEPSRAEFEKEPPLIRLHYEDCGVSLDIAVQETESHVSFEIIRAEPSDKVDAVIWGTVSCDHQQDGG